MVMLASLAVWLSTTAMLPQTETILHDEMQDLIHVGMPGTWLVVSLVNEF